MVGPLQNAADAITFRALTTRANYLVQEIARRMGVPMRSDMLLLTRLARYFFGDPRAAYTYPWQSQSARLEIYVDSDWAGCRGSRRSTSGGVVTWGAHVLNSYASTQATVALSSAEAELYSREGIGPGSRIASLWARSRCPPRGEGARRRFGSPWHYPEAGPWQVRHISTQYLWIQDKIRHD